MRSIQTLPQDVLSTIWSYLGLVDIIHLRETCTALLAATSRDKQLWALILDRDVKAQSLPVPLNLRNIGDTDVVDLESYVKHAVTLSKLYAQSDRRLFIRKIQNRRGLAVTWLKLLCGRWCLVASSNTEESQISIWEILSQGELHISARIYLEAPVIDGIVDDSDGRMHCAITVATSNPYILVIGITQSEGKVTIRQLVEIPGASHVRFLRGDAIGFAVKDGDDTHPYVMNWRIGHSHKLFIPNGELVSSSPLPLGSCIAMTIKDGYILTLHPTAIHIFAILETFTGAYTTTKRVSMLPLPEDINAGQFIHETSDESGIKSDSEFMRLYVHGSNVTLQQALVIREGSSHGPSFIVSQTFDVEFPDATNLYGLYGYRIGTSNRRVFFMQRSSRSFLPPVFHTAHIRRRACDGTNHLFSVFDEHTSVASDGLPLPHFISCVDFDDGRGIVLLGTVTGDVRIACFLEENILSRRSLIDNLPEDTWDQSRTPGAQKVYQVAVGIDLPIYYKIRKYYNFWDKLPSSLLMEVIRPWQEKGAGVLSLFGWSSDWTQFSRIWDWVLPFSRWGVLDFDFRTEITSRVARERLQALGEIIPVLYDENDHFRVIFRIGERLFYCRTKKPNWDEDEPDEFEFEDRIILGVLPCTYSQLLSDPVSVMPHASDYGTQRNLSEWIRLSSMVVQTRLLHIPFRIRIHQFGSGNVVDESQMEVWSDDDWERNYDAATAYIRSEGGGNFALDSLRHVLAHDLLFPH